MTYCPIAILGSVTFPADYYYKSLMIQILKLPNRFPIPLVDDTLLQ